MKGKEDAVKKIVDSVEIEKVGGAEGRKQYEEKADGFLSSIQQLGQRGG